MDDEIMNDRVARTSASAIGQRLEDLRAAFSHSKNDFAQLLGVTPNLYNSWISGRSVPNRIVLDLLCERFGVSADWLLRGRDHGVSLGAARKLGWVPEEPSARLLSRPRTRKT